MKSKSSAKKSILLMWLLIVLASPPMLNAQGSNDRKYVVFLIDVSGSMQDVSPSGNTKLDDIKAALTSLFDKIGNYDVKVALVTFSDSYTVLCGFTNDEYTLKNSVGSITAGGNTFVSGALDKAIRMLEGVNGNRIIVIMTDGEFDDANNAKELIKKTYELGESLVVHTIGYGSRKDINEEFLKSMAKMANGRYLYAADAEDLRSLLDMILKEKFARFILNPKPPIYLGDEVSIKAIAPSGCIFESVTIGTPYPQSNLAAKGNKSHLELKMYAQPTMNKDYFVANYKMRCRSSIIEKKFIKIFSPSAILDRGPFSLRDEFRFSNPSFNVLENESLIIRELKEGKILGEDEISQLLVVYFSLQGHPVSEGGSRELLRVYLEKLKEEKKVPFLLPPTNYTELVDRFVTDQLLLEYLHQFKNGFCEATAFLAKFYYEGVIKKPRPVDTYDLKREEVADDLVLLSFFMPLDPKIEIGPIKIEPGGSPNHLNIIRNIKNNLKKNSPVVITIGSHNLLVTNIFENKDKKGEYLLAMYDPNHPGMKWIYYYNSSGLYPQFSYLSKDLGTDYKGPIKSFRILSWLPSKVKSSNLLLKFFEYLHARVRLWLDKVLVIIFRSPVNVNIFDSEGRPINIESTKFGEVKVYLIKFSGKNYKVLANAYNSGEVSADILYLDRNRTSFYSLSTHVSKGSRINIDLGSNLFGTFSVDASLMEGGRTIKLNIDAMSIDPNGKITPLGTAAPIPISPNAFNIIILLVGVVAASILIGLFIAVIKRK